MGPKIFNAINNRFDTSYPPPKKKLYQCNEDDFLLIILWSLSSIFQITSCSWIKEKLSTSLSLHVSVSLRFENWQKVGIYIKVVFIVLINTTRTAYLSIWLSKILKFFIATLCYEHVYAFQMSGILAVYRCITKMINDHRDVIVQEESENL